MAITIDEIRKSGASARSFLWELIITNKHGLEEIAGLRCTTGNLPTPAPQKIETNIGPFTIPEAGGVEWNPLTFTCIENVKYDIINGLWLWSEQSFEPRTGVQIQKDASPKVFGDDFIEIHMQGLDRNPVISFDLIGCILSGVTFPDPNSEKAAVLEPSFEVSYAYAMKYKY